MQRLWVRTIAVTPFFVAILTVQAVGQSPLFTTIERGRYLSAAGDCQACHTTEGGKPFAGGRPLPTPFGTIYTANITPDDQTGIGGWTNDQFFRALHQGVGADGKNLYPAFPYPWYTKVTREDSDAIKAYLSTLEPVKNRRPDNTLAWPLNYRIVMEGWNTLFFNEGVFKPDTSKSAQWNRGAYLVEGLGHCGACHTPTNVLGASKKDSFLEGGKLQEWYAPSLAGDLRSGLGSWSSDDIVTFLKTGRNSHSTAYGPMSEVITFSTSKLTDDDLGAIATYLKDLPAGDSNVKPAEVNANLMQTGQAIFVDNCAACHRSNGEGVPGMFPSLKGDANVQSSDPTTVVRLILNGAHAAVTDARPTPFSMPAFGWKLNDDQIAALVNYVRNSWGNASPNVAASDVKSLRQSLQQAH
ncbi:MAG TPA: c-type cytochrome [Xanthobacteraceae bacterium]|nr:c-type cytochrome [Xanthobacteraceae bacterium]